MARVLVVDDEDIVREPLRIALETRGYHVDLAQNAAQALQIEKTRQHDVAVIDFVLPGKRGLDLLRGLRQINPFIRSIIISGQIDHDEIDSQELERQLKARVEADRYLAKPIPIEKLVEAIADLCAPLAGTSVDWKKVAADAAAASKIKAKDFREMDKVLRKNRRKRKK